MPFFTYAYQPIVRASDGRVFGYEALCRPRPHVAGSINELLATAYDAGWSGDLGAYMRDISTELIDQIPEHLSLFLNVHPLELDTELVIWARRRRHRLADRVVFEVTEGAELEPGCRAHAAVTELQQLGYRFAVDDLGAGYASLRTLTFLDPKFVKLDRAMICGIDQNERTQRLLVHLTAFAREEGITIVAEGVETEAECRTLQRLGIDLLQGYWLGRPADAPAGFLH